MSELEWMNYAGIIGGVVGTLTGIGGLIVSYISYRKVNRQNTRNLRLELQRARNAAHAAVSRLVELHEYAIKSRERISSAKGTLGSGAYQAWRAVAETDKAKIGELVGAVPNVDVTYSGLSDADLEISIIEMHRTQTWIDELVGKYQDSTDRDREDVESIRRGYTSATRGPGAAGR